jgi:hypothetical protein
MHTTCQPILRMPHATWRRTLAVLTELGVTDPQALVCSDTRTLGADWLDPWRLALLLTLQDTLGLTADEVLWKFTGYIATSPPRRLAGRLLYLQHHGLEHLVVPNRTRALQAWRRQRGLPTMEAAPNEPMLIGVTDLLKLSTANFAVLPALASSPRRAALTRERRRLSG